MKYLVCVNAQWVVENSSIATYEAETVANKLEEAVADKMIGEIGVALKTVSLAPFNPEKWGYRTSTTLTGKVGDRDDASAVSEICRSVIGKREKILFEIDFQPVCETEKVVVGPDSDDVIDPE